MKPSLEQNTSYLLTINFKVDVFVIIFCQKAYSLLYMVSEVLSFLVSIKGKQRPEKHGDFTLIQERRKLTFGTRAPFLVNRRGKIHSYCC